MRFGSPQYLWLLLLGPLLAWFLWWGIRKRQRMVAAFIPPRLLGGLLLGVSWQRERWRAVVLVAAFALFVLALAQPQWGFSWQEVKVRGLDIVVAIDTSRSMLAEDLRPNRLARAKLAAMDIAREAKSDRLALVAFAGSGFLQVPLTIDDVVFRQGVDSLSIDTIPVGGSMLAEAIRAAATAFKEGENHRVLILLSDGEDNAEGALEEARRAAEAGLRIYTIGVGTPEGSRIPVQRAGGTVEYVVNDDGAPVVTKLNEDMMRQIASATEGGIYLPLRGARTLETLYHEVLAKLPKSEHQEKLVRQYKERFHWPLTAGILLILAEMFWPMFPGRRSLPGNMASAKPSAATAKATIALLLAACATLPAPAASSSQALREYNSGDYARSLRDYEALLRKKPGDARLHYNAGAAAYQKGDIETALKHLNEAAKAEDLALQQQAYYNRGNTRFNSGSNEQDPKRRSSEWKQALQDYESALKLNGKDADAIHNREFVKRMLQELQQQNPQSSDDQQKSEDQQNSSSDNKEDQKQQQQSSEQQPQQNQQQQQENSQNSEQQDAQQKQNPNADQQKASKQPEDSSQENQQKEKERSPAEKNPQEQQQQPPSAQGQTNQPPSSADSAAGEQRPGQMTPEQARRILDSQREGEKLMPASGKQQVPGRRNLKNW